MSRNNEFLDNERSEDNLIGELFYEDGVPYRMVNNKKIAQLNESDKKDLQLVMNRVRASRMTPSEYLKMMYH